VSTSISAKWAAKGGGDFCVMCEAVPMIWYWF